MVPLLAGVNLYQMVWKRPAPATLLTHAGEGVGSTRPPVSVVAPVVSFVSVKGVGLAVMALIKSSFAGGVTPTLKVWAAEGPPPGSVVNARTGTGPAVAMSLAGTVTCMEVAEQVLGVSRSPWKSTTVGVAPPQVKPEPVAVSAKAGPPAAVEVGLMLVRVGAVPVTAKRRRWDSLGVCVASNTVTSCTPAVSRLVSIVAVSWFPLTNVVVTRVWLWSHSTFEVGFRKLAPSAVSVKLAEPAAVNEGEIDARAGPAGTVPKISTANTPRP